MAGEPQAPAAPIASPVGRLISSDSIPAGGFTPGMILADRHRVIGLPGRGGMGEVYRADDLKLGQAVALKFLPKALADDPVRRERFYAEVRIARQVSHPNTCRVYDIGEIDGRHFLICSGYCCEANGLPQRCLSCCLAPSPAWETNRFWSGS